MLCEQYVFHGRTPSTSVWGSELKYNSNHISSGKVKSTSVWGSELKYNIFHISEESIESTSVWGSELKCSSFLMLHWTPSLPLCEVVSWNKDGRELTVEDVGLPLCEVVSWNDFRRISFNTFELSTSVWGSELKYLTYHRENSMLRLPLCEVVSWNSLVSVTP